MGQKCRHHIINPGGQWTWRQKYKREDTVRVPEKILRVKDMMEGRVEDGERRRN